jgi:hypothetical protein
MHEPVFIPNTPRSPYDQVLYSQLLRATPTPETQELPGQRLLHLPATINGRTRRFGTVTRNTTAARAFVVLLTSDAPVGFTTAALRLAAARRRE